MSKTIADAPRSQKGHRNYTFTTSLKEHGYSVKDDQAKRREAIESAFNSETLAEKDHIVLGRIRDYLRSLERLHKNRSPENSARYGSDALWVEQMLKSDPYGLGADQPKLPWGGQKAAHRPSEDDPLDGIVDKPGDKFDEIDPDEEVIGASRKKRGREGEEDGSAGKRQKRPAFERKRGKRKIRRRATPEKGATAYEVLGVSTRATTAQINAAFRRQSAIHHPDKAGEESTERYQLIVRARELLLDEEWRKAYDILLGVRPSEPDVVDPPNEQDEAVAEHMMDVSEELPRKSKRAREEEEDGAAEEGAPRAKRAREGQTVEELNRERARAAKKRKAGEEEERPVKRQETDERERMKRKRRGDDEGRDFDEAAERRRIAEQYPGIERNKGAVDRMVESARKRHGESGVVNRPRRKRRVDYAELNGRGRADRADGSGFFSKAFAARSRRR